ncbi:Hypothetical_protein [Hexamita inflata]|uniref:Hypothetical_protein n=1 Tax=Hexamita inflata TaxID=28002 RepID=A0AA86PMN7_9EUKA|nr:Hypothetical protein HINF_LOCUS25552 [Hexamita inflata]
MSRLTQAQITSLIDGLAEFIVTNLGLEKLNLEASQLHSSNQVIKAYDCLLNSNSMVIDTRAIHKTCTTHLTQKLKEVKGMEKECSKQACDGNKFYRSTILSQISDVENNSAAELKKYVAHIVELVKRLIKFTEANGSQFAKFSNDVINTKNEILNVSIPKLQVFKRLRPIFESKFPKKYQTKKYLDDLQNKIELAFKISNNSQQDLTYSDLEFRLTGKRPVLRNIEQINQSISTQSGSHDQDSSDSKTLSESKSKLADASSYDLENEISYYHFDQPGSCKENEEQSIAVPNSNSKLADAAEQSTMSSECLFELSSTMKYE